MADLCPYCLAKIADSNDHVFPEFLGGKRKIRACKDCNSRFGSDFEATVCNELAPFIVMVSFSGYKHPRRVVHKKAWLDEATGIEYDLDSERQTYPNKPHIYRDGTNVKKILVRSEEEGLRLVASLKRKGRFEKFEFNKETKEGLQPPLRNVRVNVGSKMRQLAVKMCVALGQVVVPNLTIVDEDCRKFLQDKAPESSPVRQAHSRYPSLDSIRPPLAHVIYVEGNKEASKCYGIVQLFGGAFQFYVPLSDSYCEPDFAGLGIHDIRAHEQVFQLIAPLKLPEAELSISVGVYEESLACWSQYINDQILAAFGKNVITFGTSPKQTITALTTSFPMMWVEYYPEVHLALELLPDQSHDSDLCLPSNPNEWIISNDYGKTRLQVFTEFAMQWNSNKLDKSTGKIHSYVANEVIADSRLLLGESFWCPVKSLRLDYQVLQKAWQATLMLPQLSGVLDTESHSLQTTIQLDPSRIPRTRDLSWLEIEDPVAFAAAAQDLLTIESSTIDTSTLIFGNFSIADKP